MRVQVTEFAPHGSPIVVALVDSAFTVKGAGDAVIRKIAEYFPTLPIMLVSIQPNGFRAYAPFQTGELLALLQLEKLELREIDISLPAPESDEPLPF
jgi:hypothetical protein